MATAPRAQQLQLLEVSDLDARISRLTAEDSKHELRAELGEIVNLLAAKGREIQETEARVEAAQRRLATASALTDRTSGIIAEKQSRLDAGIGMDSRQLLTLQSEIDQLRERLSTQSDEEYEALEEVEDLEGRLKRNRDEQATLSQKMLTVRGDLENASGDLQSQIAELQRQRDDLFATLPEELTKPYTRARERGGMAVIGMHPNGTTTGGVEFSPIEVARIKNADPDEIIISDEYGCLVVRLDS